MRANSVAEPRLVPHMRTGSVEPSLLPHADSDLQVLEPGYRVNRVNVVETPEKIKGIAVVNGAELYYEKQGTGTAVLLIAGSTGDAGNFTRPPTCWPTSSLSSRTIGVATRGVLARLAGRRLRWPNKRTTPRGLFGSLGLSPAVVFGASAGGLIALDLMIRHPELVRAGIVQEPSIFSVLPDPIAALAPRRALIEEALRTKGPRAAIEALMRYLNDDAVFAAIPGEIARANARQRRHNSHDRKSGLCELATQDRRPH